ncbi:Far upstream element-binding protein 2 [Eumeta japonica]|uniref:Far upstream element-binding protein 2 n=1 Tax=Eumeta variegata TaxID=151549 RepID=A0A4C1Y978_EUMVA|nr:Far upstream element-binding protein 2 [Eumeta japonica]
MYQANMGGLVSKLLNLTLNYCVAAKIKEGGSKRPLEEGQEPNAKKLASADQAYQQPMSATAQAAAAAAAATARIAASGGGSGGGSSGGGGSGGGGGGGTGSLSVMNQSGMGGPPTPNIPLDQAQNEYIRVPDKMVGLVIGRGGEQITRLQAESGCKIQMAPDAGGQADRVCTLTGTREAITRAK